MTTPPAPAAPVKTPKPPQPLPRRKRIHPVLHKLLLLAGIAAVLLPIGGFALIVMPGPLTEDRSVVITRGTGVREIADQLKEAGVIYDAFVFRIAAEAIAYNSLKAGEYRIPQKTSMADAVMMMHEGKSVIRQLTVPEGLTSAEIVKLLNDNPALTGGLSVVPEEGTLLPETYRFSYGDNRDALLVRMQKGMSEALDEAWTARDPAVALRTPNEAMIMASIVEKETGKVPERPRIAGVFFNRLRINMRLQSDPTAIYAVTGGKAPLDRALTHDDLLTASPMNTYARDGLPPQPICNPGKAALNAALHPEHNDFLYFVADGTGGHVFARTLNEHNGNVTHWNQFHTSRG